MIESILRDYSQKLETRFDILLHESSKPYDKVVTASRYSLLDGGKRIRPIMLLEFYRLFGGEDDCAYNFACALEMIHTYSLIHDDLPCMDDDDVRRGKPSNHKQFDEATALLAGDALLTEAFNVASKTLGIAPEFIVKALNVLATNAGISGMIGGQVMDISAEKGEDVDILEIYRLKTGALLNSAATIGAVLAGADDEQIEKCGIYAEKVGIAFQIIDDILDFEGDAELFGKPIGSDQKNGKQTFVSLNGLEESREYAKKLTEEAIDILNSFGEKSVVLVELTKYLLSRKY